MSTTGEMQAAETLRWIAENMRLGKERIQATRQRLDDLTREFANPPPAQDGFDYQKAIEVARDQLLFEENQHFKWMAKQQLFDKSVAPDKRDTSEAITRNEGARLFSMFAIYMRTACENFTTKIIPAIRESKSNEDAYTITADSLRECLTNAMDSAVREAHLPAWAKEAVDSTL